MNTITLPYQVIPLSDLITAIGKSKGNLRKLFFQCEMVNSDDDRAVFGLVIYPGFKKKGKWIFGEKISLINSAHKEPKTFNLPVIFGNMELSEDGSLKKVDKSQLAEKGKGYKKGGRILKSIRKQLKGKKLSKKKVADSSKQFTETVLLFEPYVTENPHVSYLLTSEGSIDFLNPSPPAPPRGIA